MTVRKVVNIKKQQESSRSLSAWQKEVEQRGLFTHYRFAVESHSCSTLLYLVILKTGTDDKIRTRCGCKWAEHNGIACKHVLAAVETWYRQQGKIISFWSSQEAAFRQKRSVVLIGADSDAVDEGSVIYGTLRPAA